MNQPRRLPALTCGCCDRRAWRSQQPKCPQAFLCDACLDWIESFNHGPAPGTTPITGPVKSVRIFLANQPITGAEIHNDTSPWILLFQPRNIARGWRQRVEQIYTEPATILQAVPS